MIAIHLIVLLLLFLVTGTWGARFARFYFNKVYVRILLNRENYRPLWLVDGFALLLPALLGGFLIAYGLEYLLFRFFPSLSDPLFTNLRFLVSGATFMGFFFLQIQRDRADAHKTLQRLKDSGEMETLIDRAYQKMQEEENRAGAQPKAK